MSKYIPRSYKSDELFQTPEPTPTCDPDDITTWTKAAPFYRSKLIRHDPIRWQSVAAEIINTAAETRRQHEEGPKQITKCVGNRQTKTIQE